MRRRAFLQFLSAAPVAAPLAAKAAADEAILGTAGVFADRDVRENVVSSAGMKPFDEDAAVKAASKIPGLRQELETLLFEQCSHVDYLDIDIANKRSFSPAAKIAFQRQRNVEREWERRLAGYEGRPYRRIEGLLAKAIGWKL